MWGQVLGMRPSARAMALTPSGASVLPRRRRMAMARVTAGTWRALGASSRGGEGRVRRWLAGIALSKYNDRSVLTIAFRSCRMRPLMTRLIDLASYADAQRHFSSAALWQLFDGGREWLNIGHECVDRHA